MTLVVALVIIFLHVSCSVSSSAIFYSFALNV